MYGRTIVYKITAPIYILFLVAVGESTTFGSLVVCRLLAGLAGAPVLAVGAGTNADMFLPRDRALSGAFFIMMPFLGPSMGPLIVSHTYLRGQGSRANVHRSGWLRRLLQELAMDCVGEHRHRWLRIFVLPANERDIQEDCPSKTSEEARPGSTTWTQHLDLEVLEDSVQHHID